MPRIEIKGQEVRWGESWLGPVGSLLLDPQEALKLLSVHDRITPAVGHLLPGRMDGLIAFGEGQVVGLEIKRSDLLSSIHSRMLARQVRTLRQLCDHAIIVVLGGATTDAKVCQYLAAAQRLGVGVCWVMDDILASSTVVPQIMAFAREWAHGNALKAVAGTDRRPSREGGPGWFLRNLRGCGPGLAARLHAH